MIGIYKITNLINGKVYIGQSRDISKRWNAHRSRAFNFNANDYEKVLYRAIRKYGLENFIFEIIETCPIQNLNERENYWIKYYNSNDTKFGYNLSLNGSEDKSIKLDLKQVEQIQELLQNTKLSQEDIAKQFNISQRMVSGINIGENWLNEKLVYPLRKKPIISSELKNHSKCQKCGKLITLGANYCFECNSFMQRKVTRPDRDTLKELIRTNSFCQIGKMYSVTDNTIRKWCKTYNLPYKKTEINKISEEKWNSI